MFFLALNELGFPPANKLVDETLELLVRYRVWGGFVCALFHSFGLRVSLTYTVKTNTHTHARMYTMYQMSSCSLSSLICCELFLFFFFWELPATFCFCSLFHPFLSLGLYFLHLPHGSCWTSCCGCLQTPSTHRHYPYAYKSLSLIIGRYRTPTSLTTQHGVIASVQYCLIIFLDTREADQYGTLRHSPSVRGPRTTDSAGRWLRWAKSLICPYQYS